MSGFNSRNTVSMESRTFNKWHYDGLRRDYCLGSNSSQENNFKKIKKSQEINLFSLGRRFVCLHCHLPSLANFINKKTKTMVQITQQILPVKLLTQGWLG